MPIVRYQIRNEYGLADPELYGAADKEDPEALLEGVAMAGLVGVLRQLGDLAEFAAEIFHNLHEEVMATAARGHALMLRVQQLEVDFPAIEKGFLSPTSHSQVSYNAGIDWHPNLQFDQNLITREDMPRFILDSYEESRGPPRLFMLDKFDIAGDGACLKRYSDPSFFKIDFAASGKMEPDIQREKRSRKNKKKVPRLRNGETPESYFTQHANPKLEHAASEKAPENPPVKRVKLKTRQLNDNTTIRRSYIEHIVGNQSPEHTELSENSIRHSQVKMKTADSTELAPDVREVIMDTSIDRPFFRDRNRTKRYNKEELSRTQKDEMVSDIRDSQNEKKGLLQKAIGEVEKLPPNFNKADHEEFFDADHKREGNGDAEIRTNGSLDSYRSDAAASELDNYLDALTTMDSEIETDNEIKAKPTSSFFIKEYSKTYFSVNEEMVGMDSEIETDSETKAKPTPNFFSKEYNKMDPNVNEERATMDSEIETYNETKGKPTPSFSIKEYNRMGFNSNEERDLLDEHLSSHVIRESSTQNGLSNERISSPPKEDSLFSLADSTPSHGTSVASPGMFIDPEAPAGETHDTNFESKANGEHLKKESSVDLVEEQMIPDIPIPLSESRVASTTTTDTTAAQIYTDLHASSEDIQSAIGNENTSSVNTNSTEKGSICFDGQYSPPVNSVLGAAEDTNVTFCSLVEGHGEVDKLLEDDFHKKSDESKVPSIAKNDDVNPGLVSQDTDIISDDLLQLGDGSDLNIQMQEDLSIETQIAVLCFGETSAEEIISIPSVPDPPQIVDATNLEITPPTCIEDSVSPLSMFDAELHGSACQGPEVDSGGSTLPGKSPPVPPLDNSSGTFVPDGIIGSIDNSDLTNEKFECERSLTIPGDVADFTEHKVTSPENTGNFAENEVMASGISLPGPPFDMNVPQESCNLDQVEFTQKDELPNILKVLPNVSNYDTIDSFLVNETRDSLLPTRELPAESCSQHSVTECSEADELYSPTMHLKESSSKAIQEEDRVCSDSSSEKQELEITEASCLKDLIDLDLQQVPGTAASQEEYVMVGCPQDSVSAGYVLDSSSLLDCGEPDHVCHTESFELAQDDLYPTDDNRVPISFAEVEGEKLLTLTSQNEPQSIESGVEHYVGNIEASNSDDLTGEDDHQASKIDFPGQEESNAVGDPGDSKSTEAIHDSFNNMVMQPVISVPCQEDQKMVASLQTSRTEEKLLESCDNSDYESIKHAELIMNLSEVTEVIECPSVNQVPQSKPPASCESCQAANGDVLLSEDVITENISPLTEVFNSQSSGESDEISLLNFFGRLDLSDIQFEREQSRGQDDNFKKTERQPSMPEAAQDSVNYVSSDQIYESGIPSANVSSLNQLETESGSSIQSSLGIPVTCAIFSASLASVQSFPSPGSSSTVMIQQHSSELPLDKDPPLPPLPPLQWRTGKLRLSSIMTNGEMTGPQGGVNSLTALPSLDYSGGPLVMGGAMVQPVNPFLQVTMHPSDSDRFGCQPLEEERMNPFQASALPPAVEDLKCHGDMLALDAQMKCLPANSSSVVSHVEDDQQKNEFCQEALLNPFTSPVELSDVRYQHFHTVSEGESIEPPKSSASQPTLVCTESLHETSILDTVTIHPSNPFLSSGSPESEHCQYDRGEPGNRMVQHLSAPESMSTAEIAPRGYAPDTMSTAEIAPQGFLISQEGNMETFECFTLPAAETEQPNGRPRFLLNRPRDPLIEAVAAHDKSTLRRVSEMVRPSAKPESERNTLLEQIRNKSFSLKPATVAKPHMKGPPTNLKVAAILERANAIRQAFVGSDEDDDGDSWSDS